MTESFQVMPAQHDETVKLTKPKGNLPTTLFFFYTYITKCKHTC